MAIVILFTLAVAAFLFWITYPLPAEIREEIEPDE